MTEEAEAKEVVEKYWDLFAYFLILLVLFIQLMHMSVDPAVDPKFVSFYTDSMIGGIMILLGMTVFRWRYGDALNLPLWAKLAWTGVFTVLIIFMTLKQGQIIGVPDSMTLGAALPKESQIYNSAVFPAFGEDMIWLVGLPMGLTFAFLATVEKILEWEIGWGEFLTFAVVACVISAFVFTAAHQQAYQDQRIAYTGAFVYATGQSITYMATGILLPIAHMIHNFLVEQNRLYQMNIFGYSVLGGG